MQQRRDSVGQQLIKEVDVLRAEVAEHVIIDTDTAADPHVSGVSCAELRNPATTAHTFNRGKHPQGEQNPRIGMIATGLPFDGLNLFIKRRQIERIDISPDITNLMFEQQHLIERQRPHFDLQPFGPADPSLTLLRLLIGIHNPLVARPPPPGQVISIGQVARGDCSPRAPIDPYVPALEYTAPHIRRLPRDVERPIEQRALVEAGTIRAAD